MSVYLCVLRHLRSGNMRNPRFSSLLKWVSSTPAEHQFKPYKTLISGDGFFCIAPNPRFFATQRALKPREVEDLIRYKPTFRKKVEAVMLDYFYGTRGLQFMLADSMSKNAPVFLGNLLKKINGDADIANIAQSMRRYLRFHPLNEFEPFLESLGLKQSEYCNLLPADKMFLCEDALLLENHYVLCKYGIAREKMGKIYREATEIFGYETGVLASKIRAYEDLGLSKSCISKLMVCSPRILIGDRNVELANVVEMLKSIGFGDKLMAENLSDKESYDWSDVHRALNFLRDIGFPEDEFGGLIRKHPKLIFERSGKWTLILIGFQTKFGSSKREIRSFFLQLPQIEVPKFVSNLRNIFSFLNEIEMETDEICKIFRSHSWWLGSCRLKKTGSLLIMLNAGKVRLCQIIQENPEELKKWTMGSKIQQLPDSGEEFRSRMMKIQFLLDMGYKENSKDLNNALINFRAKGSELQERFDFIVSLGLNVKDVKEMVKASPQILAQGTDVVKAKVDYLVNELGFPLSRLVHFPSYLKFTLERIKLRFSMYSWLKDKGKVNGELAISTILACSDKYFAKNYVSRHPDGPKHWEDLKKQILSE